MPEPMKLKFVWQPKQQKLLQLTDDSKATWLGYGGSRGGAKSHAGRNILLLRRIKIPGSKGCIFRRTYDLVRENHVDPLLREFPFMRSWYHEGHKELRLPNGSVLAFRYGETRKDVESMIGKEYMDFLCDQAEAFTEHELTVMKSCVRTPGKPESFCKFILTFNPGNVGHKFLQRIFYDRDYRGEEKPEDYTFIQAFAWDNVEWSRAALETDGLTVEDYYAWDSDKRFNYFVTRTQEGKKLNALPPALRVGWLLGSMDQFAGQYFDIFSMERHVANVFPDSWMSKWIGIDWGFAHNSAAHWCSQVKNDLTAVYREFCGAGRSPRALAQEIVDRTPPEERPYIRGIGLSHDAFARRDERDSAAEQMAEVFVQAGMPYPVRAGRDVVGSAARLYSMFDQNEIVIHPSCQELIKVIPMVTRDPQNAEKTIKFDGDDAFDSLKHALQVRQPSDKVPQRQLIYREASAIQDPLSRWFFLTRRLKRQQNDVVLHNPPMSVFESEARNGFLEKW